VIHDADVVSGGYCQHTEGFGEMAEKEKPLTRRPADFKYLVSPLFAFALSEPELRSSHPHPAGAPVAHLSRPVVADDDQPRRRPARVTRPSTHVMPKTGCGFDYFFFRRFVVFFAAFFAFLFFATAALLA
jgi:hypothetical protein